MAPPAGGRSAARAGFFFAVFLPAGCITDKPSGASLMPIGRPLRARHRLVWVNLLGPGFKPQAIAHPGFGFVCELQFDRLPEGGTRYQAHVHHVDAAGRDAHAAMGFHEGWNAALNQLVEMVQGNDR